MKVLWRIAGVVLIAGLFPFSTPAAKTDSAGADWISEWHAARGRVTAAPAGPAQTDAAKQSWLKLESSFPIQWDWMMQDLRAEGWRWLLAADHSLERQMISRVVEEVGPGGPIPRTMDQLINAGVPATDRRWLELYERACELRREVRLAALRKEAPRMVFTKRRTIRPSFFAYTEAQSDAQHERHFLPGSELCLLDMSGESKVRVLVSDPTGMIRDPAVSWDGTRIVFAWKKSLNEDDYHLYEYEVASGQVRQITSGLGFADYEPAFLPNGDLIFASTRCVQTVDCFWTEVSNLYTCDATGRFLRRLGVDQVHTVYPQVMDDGRVVYTRWDYNDRGQVFPQPLFQMNMDGTGQGEFYGNSSWFPTTIAHARGIPGTGKVLAILCGHHTSQAGKLAIVDPGRGRQENSGVQLVAPVRATAAERIDAYGQEGELWQYPYPLNERELVVGFAPLGWESRARRVGDADFGIYWMDVDGRRELLVWDDELPVSQPVPLRPRPRPATRPSQVDYAQDRGTYYLQDVYTGRGLAGVPRGTIKKLRVVSLSFRAAGVGQNFSAGPGGGALISTPVAIGNGTWDVKNVLGETTVHADGSAYFTVPARTPVYFQALDARGYAVQTMRTWSTLQPGERLGCVGCHEPRNASAPEPAGHAVTLALKAGPEHLAPEPGASGFSFPRQVQPILDRHCVRCHDERPALAAQLSGGTPVLGAQPMATNHPAEPGKVFKAFTLLGEENVDSTAKRKWSDAYLVLTGARSRNRDAKEAYQGLPTGRVVNWVSSQSAPEPQAPMSAGSTRSSLMELLENGHYGVNLTREELARVACWIDLSVPFCGDYAEANAWTEDEARKYERYASKRKRMQAIEQENIHEFMTVRQKLVRAD